MALAAICHSGSGCLLYTLDGLIASNYSIHTRLNTDYPDTDIPGSLVTTFVGDISETRIQEALGNGMTAVEEFRRRGLNFEALLAVKGRTKMTNGMLPNLRNAA